MGELLDLGVKAGIVDKSGAWYKFRGMSVLAKVAKMQKCFYPKTKQ